MTTRWTEHGKPIPYPEGTVPQVSTRTCCECGDAFVPQRERQIRCTPCQVQSDFA